MEYKQFLQQSGKSELLSFFRRYENSMNRRKKFIAPEQFFEVEQDKKKKEFDKAMEEVKKVVQKEEREQFKEVSK